MTASKKPDSNLSVAQKPITVQRKVSSNGSQTDTLHDGPDQKHGESQTPLKLVHDREITCALVGTGSFTTSSCQTDDDVHLLELQRQLDSLNLIVNAPKTPVVDAKTQTRFCKVKSSACQTPALIINEEKFLELQIQLAAALADHESSKAQFEIDKKSIAAELETTKIEIDKFSVERNSVHLQMESKSVEIQKLTSERDQARRDLEENTIQYQALIVEKTDVQSQLKTQIASYEKLVLERDRLQSEKMLTAKEHSSHSEKLLSMEKLGAELQEKIKFLESLKVTNEAELLKQREEIRLLRVRTADLELELKKSEMQHDAELDAADDRLEELLTKYDRLEERSIQLETAYREAQKQIELLNR